MVRLLRKIKGIKNETHGGKFPLNGQDFYCLHGRHFTPEFVPDTINRVLNCMVPAVLKFNTAKINTSNNFNVKELPVRAADTAHWSGPLVAAR